VTCKYTDISPTQFTSALPVYRAAKKLVFVALLTHGAVVYKGTDVGETGRVAVWFHSNFVALLPKYEGLK
jgi:hypothetical protein